MYDISINFDEPYMYDISINFDEPYMYDISIKEEGKLERNTRKLERNVKRAN